MSLFFLFFLFPKVKLYCRLTMNGIGIMRIAMPPKSVPAHLKVNFAYICVVNSGNAVPARFPIRMKRCSVRFPSSVEKI